MLGPVNGRLRVLCLMMAAGLGCSPRGPSELKVSAAMSLKEAFTEFEAAFEARHPEVDVVFNFAGSQTLSAQIVEGAQVDVFASADAVQMQRAIGSGRIAQGAGVRDEPAGADHAGRQPREGDGRRRSGAARGAAGARRADVADGRVRPRGAGAAGDQRAALANVVSNEENVRGVVGKVASGEADAGIVYVTDVTPAVAAKLRQIALKVAVTPRYEVAILKDNLHPPLAQAVRRGADGVGRAGDAGPPRLLAAMTGLRTGPFGQVRRGTRTWCWGCSAGRRCCSSWRRWSG
jgi:molybdate transport system substrate-binding protein